MGLLGGAHCAVMCGGVVAMSCSALVRERRARPVAQLPYVLAYNAGRIASYATGGAVAGSLGSTLASFGVVERAQLALRLAAGAMMLAVGLYVAGFAGALRWAEGIGRPVWRRIEPLARRLVPVRSPGQALGLGLLWGWMPCGLVYAALAAAVTAGSAAGGAVTMAAFGLGTLPTLVTMGSAAALVARWASDARVRRAAGIAILALGAVQLVHVGQAWAATRQGAVPACCAHHHHHAGT
jgi:sulfite exporter TauE/SafE